MELKTEEIIKILLILGVLYLLFNCILTENFSELPLPAPDMNPATGFIDLASGNEELRLVRFADLKNDFKILFLKQQLLPSNFETLTEDDKKKYEIEYYQKSFFDAMDVFSLNTPLVFDKEKDEKIKKQPLVIIPLNKVNEYTDNPNVIIYKVKNTPEKTILFENISKERNEFLQWSQHHKILFQANQEEYGVRIKGFTTTENAIKKIIIEPLIDKNTTFNLKLTKKGDNNFTYYSIDKEGDMDINWKWQISQ